MIKPKNFRKIPEISPENPQKTLKIAAALRAAMRRGFAIFFDHRRGLADPPPLAMPALDYRFFYLLPSDPLRKIFKFDLRPLISPWVRKLGHVWYKP